MTLALKWGEADKPEAGGFIYFDAVSSFTENHRGQVTKHPVDSGASITDHFIKENSVYNITAVISSVDISNALELLQDLDGNVPFNISPVTEPVSIGGAGPFEKFKKFIPSSIDQFIPDPSVEVKMQDVRTDYLPQIKAALKDLIGSKVYNLETGQFDTKIQTVQLYEYDNSIIKNIINNLVLTAFNVREDVSTGVGLYCDFTLEAVEFVYLKKTEIPQNIIKSLNQQAAEKKSLGKADSKATDADEAAEKGDKKAEKSSALKKAAEAGKSLYEGAKEQMGGILE